MCVCVYVRLLRHCHNKHSKAERLFRSQVATGSVVRLKSRLSMLAHAHTFACTHTHRRTHERTQLSASQRGEKGVADGRHVDRWKLKRFTFEIGCLARTPSQVLCTLHTHTGKQRHTRTHTHTLSLSLTHTHASFDEPMIEEMTQLTD